MNHRNTWWWVALALGLFAFIFFVDRRWTPSDLPPDAVGKLLPGFRAASVTAMQVRRGAQFVHLEHIQDGWRLTQPIAFPAQPVLIEALLKAIEDLDRQAHIPTTAFADFGLADPRINMVIQSGTARAEIQIGSNSPGNDQVYVRVVGQEGVYAVDAGLLGKIPETINDWRSRALLCSATSFVFDRFEVRSAVRGLGYALQHDTTNKTWRIIKPMQARAERAKVEQLLLKALSGRVTQFVSDDAKKDLDPLGLQPPELELALGTGTNDLLSVQFGKSPTNDPTQIYARQVNQTSIVLVAKELVDTLRTPYSELRERRLLSFIPASLSQIEMRGLENFTLQRQTNQAWRITEPQDYPADTTLTREFLTDLLSVQATDFENDVVTDFSAYGLVTPLRQILLKTAATNGAGTTNLLLVEIDFGTNAAGKYFARRTDEISVYAIQETDILKLTTAAWQLRDRQIWNFSVTNVIRATITQGGRTHQLIRSGVNDWGFGPNSQGMLNAVSLERSVSRLGALQAGFWVARGIENRARYGFTDDGYQLSLELKRDGKIQTVSIELGGLSKSQAPYASTTIDGQLWFFELPWIAYQDILQDLSMPKPIRATATP